MIVILPARSVLTEQRERLVVRGLQLVVAAVLVAGLFYGELGVVVNAAVGLGVTLLPAVLERRYRFTMNAGLVLWITVAMLLHAVGTLPLPGLGFLSAYTAVWWWDHMTHALSSSLVAGVAYAVTRALEEHSDYIVIPSRFMFVYLVIFVMAFGVIWELLEFYIAVVTGLLGFGNVLTQYGLDDTVLDLIYNTIGGVLLALFGTAYLTDVVEQLADRLGRRPANR